ncbi:MAG: hypothetical protein J5I59_00180 [Saprospiraceae bacterium]|nr:hypothetical protein [Saprospiraceae bacterium]
MGLSQALSGEIGHESKSTLKLLERVPDEHFDWRPHEKSMTLKALATHIAQLGGYPAIILNTDVLDFANSPIKKPEINGTVDLVRLFQNNNEDTLAALAKAGEDDFKQLWTLRVGEHIVLEAPRAIAIRQVGLNHLYHHRAQLGVYLRILNIPIPGMYGPSADEGLRTK